MLLRTGARRSRWTYDVASVVRFSFSCALLSPNIARGSAIETKTVSIKWTKLPIAVNRKAGFDEASATIRLAVQSEFLGSIFIPGFRLG